jgi:hypothetical protein
MKNGRWMMVAALAVGLGVAAPAAGAGSNTSVTIRSHTADGFVNGKVRSSRHGCKGDRKVWLFWDSPGAPRDFEPVADDASQADGDWRINSPGGPVPPGRYFARVKRHRQCDRARSETITVSLG